MPQTYFIETPSLDIFLRRLARAYQVFVPAARGKNFTREDDYSFKPLTDSVPVIFNPYRSVEPLKTFFTNPVEKAADYFAGSKAAPESRKAVIFGVKSCDIAGHKIQDYVFLEGVTVDGVYRIKRENTVLIAGDCTDFKSVCHCLAWDIMPYPTSGFDLSLAPLSEGYVVEVGSQKGTELIGAHSDLFVPAKDAQLTARQAKRENLVGRLRKHLLPQNLVAKDSVQRLMREGYHLDTWKNFMLTCVECGGCNFICDTCHCFLLADRAQDGANAKLKLWDSCQYLNYARVAGGANPNKTRASRLRFRFTKKFDFFVDQLKVPACCGCGRCIEVCPGKIDIREVLKDLAKRLDVK